MIKIAICDDSNDFLNQTKNMLTQWKNYTQPISIDLFQDGDELINAHHKHPYDIILLDMIMPLLNGIETASEIRTKDKNVKIVFLTSTSEFAVDSYRVKASNYLLKPIQPPVLYQCINEIIHELNKETKMITIKGVDAIHKIPIHQIIYIESQNKHIVFYTTIKKEIISNDPLYMYEQKLQIEDGFYKCHRSYIINVLHVNSYSYDEVVMIHGIHIPISRKNKKSFEDVYFQITFEHVGDF